MKNEGTICNECGFVLDTLVSPKFCPACGCELLAEDSAIEPAEPVVANDENIDLGVMDLSSLPPIAVLPASPPPPPPRPASQDAGSSVDSDNSILGGNPQRYVIIGLVSGLLFSLLTTIGLLAWVMLSRPQATDVARNDTANVAATDTTIEETDPLPQILDAKDGDKQPALTNHKQTSSVAVQSDRKPAKTSKSTNFANGQTPTQIDSTLAAGLVPAIKEETSFVKKRSRGELIASIKDATVYIQVQGTKGSGSGTGFVFLREKDFGYVVTNAHVVKSDIDKIEKVVCVFRSGLPQQTKHEAKILYVDKDADLAILQVQAEDLPEPIDTSMPEEVYETLSVMIAGFPFGEMMNVNQDRLEITIGQGSVSSIRNDDRGRTRVLQIDGDINPGNSGGPVLDQEGRLVAIANATIQGTNIGFAIPRRFLDDITRGDVTSVAVVPEGSTTTSLKYKVEANIIDPLFRIQYISILVFQQPDVDLVPETGLPWPAAAREPMLEQVFGITSRRGDEVKMLTTFEIPITEANADQLHYQIKINYRDKSHVFQSPALIASTKESGFALLQPARKVDLPPDNLEPDSDRLATHLSRAMSIKLPAKLADFDFDQGTGDIYGTDFENGRVSRFAGKDLRFGRVGEPTHAEIGGHPIGILLKPFQEKEHLFVRSHDSPAFLVLDPQTMKVQHTITVEAESITKLSGSRNPTDPMVFYVGQNRGEKFLGAIDIRTSRDLGNLGYPVLDAEITSDGKHLAIATNRPRSSVSYLRRESELTDDRPTFSRSTSRIVPARQVDRLGNSDLFQVYDGMWGDQLRERVTQASNLGSLSIAATDDAQYFFAMSGSRTVQRVASRLHTMRRDNTEHSPTVLLPKEFGRQNYRLSFKENNRMRYINFDLKTRAMIQKERHEFVCCNSDFVLRIPMEALGFPREHLRPLTLVTKRFDATVGKESILTLSCSDPAATISSGHLPEGAAIDEAPDGSAQLRWRPHVDQVGTHVIEIALELDGRRTNTQARIQVRSQSLSLPVNSAGFSLDPKGNYVITWSAPTLDRSDQPSIDRGLKSAQPSIIQKIPLRRDQAAAHKQLSFPLFAVAMTNEKIFLVSARNRTQLIVLSAEKLDRVKSILTGSAIEGITVKDGRLLMATQTAHEVYDAETLKIERSSTHAQRPTNMPGNHTLVDGVIRDGVLYDGSNDRRKLLVSLRRIPSMSAGRVPRLNGSFLRTRSSKPLIPNLQKIVEKEDVSHVSSTLPIADSDRSVAIQLKLSKPKKRDASETSQMQMQLAALIVNRKGDILSTHQLTDEPLRDELVIHPPTMKSAGSYFFINFGHRLYRWKPTLDQQNAGMAANPVDLYFVPEQDAFTVDRKTTELQHGLQGGSGDHSLFLMSRLDGVTLDERTATVKIDRGQVIDQTLNLLRDLLKHPSTMQEFNLRFREAKAVHAKEFMQLTGRTLQGFPIGIPIHLKASDPNGEIAEIQYFVICDIRTQEVARRVVGLN